MLLFLLKIFSLKHSCIVAKMNGFFNDFTMTVVDKHICSSPFVILAYGCIRPSASREQRYLAYKYSDVHDITCSEYEIER